MYKAITFITLIFFCLNPVHGQSWAQKGQSIIPGDSCEFFGSSISMSADGKTMAVGVPGNNCAKANPGTVRVYIWNDSLWTQLGQVIVGEADGDRFGEHVCLSSDGKSLAVNAPNDSGNGKWAGHVRIYKWLDTIWEQKGQDIEGLDSTDAASDISISADGSTVAIGSPIYSNKKMNAGHVRVFYWKETAWIQRGTDIDGDDVKAYFGWSVSLSADGKILAIGSPFNKKTNGDGAVKVYEWNNYIWWQIGNSLTGDSVHGERFGGNVCLNDNGDILLVSAPFPDGYSNGSVSAFRLVSLVWEQLGSVLVGKAEDDYFGTSISLNAIGNIIAVGDPYNDKNGSSSGTVRLFAWESGDWEQQGSELFGDTAFTRLGMSVSLDSIGKSVAVGAPAFFNKKNVVLYNHVKVFEQCINTYSSTTKTSYCSFRSHSGKDWFQSGRYVDTIKNAIGCDSFITIDLTILPHRFNLQPLDTSAKIGETTFFCVASDSGNFQWQMDSGSGFQNILNTGKFKGANKDTLYILNIDTTNNNQRFRCLNMWGGCKDTSEIATLNVLKNIGIETGFISGINIYPNPTNGKITVSLDKVYQSVEYRLMNLVGELVLENTINSVQIFEVEINRKSGFYYLEIQMDNKSIFIANVLKMND